MISREIASLANELYSLGFEDQGMQGNLNGGILDIYLSKVSSQDLEKISNIADEYGIGFEICPSAYYGQELSLTISFEE